MATSADNLRFLRAVPDPIPWYLRVGYHDHRLVENKLSAGDTRMNRAVLDAACLERHSGLVKALQTRGAELVLDPRSAELAMPVGRRDTLQGMPWSGLAVASEPSQYGAARIRGITRRIAEVAVSEGFSAVLAPTHYLSTPSDRWIDAESAAMALSFASASTSRMQISISTPEPSVRCWKTR